MTSKELALEARIRESDVNENTVRELLDDAGIESTSVAGLLVWRLFEELPYNWRINA